MNKYIFLFAAFFVFSSCDDGDFESPSFEFGNTIYGCGTYLLYRTTDTGTEAYIVNLLSTDLPTEEGSQMDLPLGGTRTVTYRIFDDKVTTDYFCNNIPPSSPNIVDEWITGGGTMDIITTAEYDEDQIEVIGFNHEILINNLVLVKGENEIRQSTYDFGTVSTVIVTN